MSTKANIVTGPLLRARPVIYVTMIPLKTLEAYYVSIESSAQAGLCYKLHNIVT